MSELLDDEDVRLRLRAACEAAGGVRAFARKNGLSASLVSEVATGIRMPTKAILACFRLTRVHKYKNIDAMEESYVFGNL